MNTHPWNLKGLFYFPLSRRSNRQGNSLGDISGFVVVMVGTPKSASCKVASEGLSFFLAVLWPLHSKAGVHTMQAVGTITAGSWWLWRIRDVDGPQDGTVMVVS